MGKKRQGTECCVYCDAISVKEGKKYKHTHTCLSMHRALPETDREK